MDAHASNPSRRPPLVLREFTQLNGESKTSAARWEPALVLVLPKLKRLLSPSWPPMVTRFQAHASRVFPPQDLPPSIAHLTAPGDSMGPRYCGPSSPNPLRMTKS